MKDTIKLAIGILILTTTTAIGQSSSCTGDGWNLTCEATNGTHHVVCNAAGCVETQPLPEARAYDQETDSPELSDDPIMSAYVHDSKTTLTFTEWKKNHLDSAGKLIPIPTKTPSPEALGNGHLVYLNGAAVFPFKSCDTNLKTNDRNKFAKPINPLRPQPPKLRLRRRYKPSRTKIEPH